MEYLSFYLWILPTLLASVTGRTLLFWCNTNNCYVLKDYHYSTMIMIYSSSKTLDFMFLLNSFKCLFFPEKQTDQTCKLCMQRCPFTKSEQLYMKLEPIYKCDICHRIFQRINSYNEHRKNKICTRSLHQRKKVAEIVRSQNTESLDNISANREVDGQKGIRSYIKYTKTQLMNRYSTWQKFLSLLIFSQLLLPWHPNEVFFTSSLKKK